MSFVNLGWPDGMDQETATWLVEQCRVVLDEARRPLATWQVYDLIDHRSRYSDATPPLWRRASVLSWLYDAVERALRELDAQQAWVPKGNWILAEVPRQLPAPPAPRKRARRV